MDPTSSILEQIRVAQDDPRFSKRVFIEQAKRHKGKIPLVAEEFGSLSSRLTKSLFQEPSLVRCLFLSRDLASRLINDQGELDLQLLSETIEALRNHVYFLGPGWEDDAPRRQQLLDSLSALHDSKNLQRHLKLMTRPSGHKVAEQIIRDTLLLPEHVQVNDAMTRRAVLSAWLCPLRQNVGSCFATAPAILVQQEQPEQFLKDMSELLATGRLKRVVGGVEYSAPLALSWGADDLRRPVPLLEENRSHLSESPGLLHALEAGGLIDPALPRKERQEKASAWVLRTLDQGEWKGGFITAEEILQKIFLEHFKITEKDLKDFQERPRGMVHTSLLMTAPVSGQGMGGKGEACASYIAQFTKAKNAFKAIQENALLKSWEFTIASFAETKPGFTRWNMYASLGFNSDEPGGIGACLYREVQSKLDQANRKMHDMQDEYEMVFQQLKYMEARYRSASSEKEVQWLRIEYESKRNEFHTLEELRNKLHFQAERCASLLTDLLDAYDQLFPRYFQEVYDPDMHEISVGPYEDSPAGFRLLYKHGRSNTSQWTLIYTPQDFIESLSSFFVSTENELVNMPVFEGMQQDISDLVTLLVQHIKTDDFLLTSFQRMAKAHQAPLIKDPLQNWEQVDKKPWAYTSGGTMSNLIRCYFKLDQKPTEQERWVENEAELIVYLIDLIKQLPAKLQDELKALPGKKILIHSPTHAFSLMPSFPEFAEALSQDIFTYTYVRDHMIKSPQRFVESQFLDGAMMEQLFKVLSVHIPEKHRERFLSLAKDFNDTKTPPEFRSALKLSMEEEYRYSRRSFPILSTEVIDGALYEALPFTPQGEIRNRMERLLLELPGIEAHREAIQSAIDGIAARRGAADLLSAQQLRQLCQAALCIALDATSTAIDYPYLIAEKARELGYAMPCPLRFADTNWAKDYFAFLVNPGTGALDLWRVNVTATLGAPMASWREWLNGSRKDRTWGVYTKPYEYRLT
jgi:hypothetical protein